MSDDEGMEDAFLSSSESDRSPITNYNACIVDTAPRKYGQKTVVGQVRNIKRFTWLEWLFIVIGIITFLSTLGLTIERFFYFEANYNSSHNASKGNDELEECNSWTCSSDATFAGILIVTIVFCFFYGLDGVLRERGYELLSLIAAIILLLVYLSTNFIYHIVKIHKQDEMKFSSREMGVRITRLVIAWILGPILGALALGIFFKLGRLMFTIVGGNRELMRAYKIMSFFSTLLLFNAQAMITILVLVFVRHGTFLSLTEMIIILNIAGWTIGITIMGWIMVLYEFKIATVTFLVFLLPAGPYYVYKIIDVSINFSLYEFDRGVDNHYDFIAVTIIILNFLALLLLILIEVFGILAITNFNKGLKDKIDLPFFWCYQKVLAVKRRKI